MLLWVRNNCCWFRNGIWRDRKIRVMEPHPKTDLHRLPTCNHTSQTLQKRLKNPSPPAPPNMWMILSVHSQKSLFKQQYFTISLPSAYFPLAVGSPQKHLPSTASASPASAADVNLEQRTHASTLGEIHHRVPTGRVYISQIVHLYQRTEM